MIDFAIKDIKTLLNSGIKPSEISIITPIIDDMLRFQIKENIVPNWEMQGFFNQFGSIRWSNTFPNYKISTPLKLYERDKVKISCYAVTNDPVLMEFQDRWNTYWANALGNRNVLII